MLSQCDAFASFLGKNIDTSKMIKELSKSCPKRTKHRLAATIKATTTAEDAEERMSIDLIKRLIQTPDNVYNPDCTSMPYHPPFLPSALLASFQNYANEFNLTSSVYHFYPYACDSQIKYHQITFMSESDILKRLQNMTNIHFNDTKINRFHKNQIIHVVTIVSPIITKRSIQTIVRDDKQNIIRLSIYNWFEEIATEEIKKRLKCKSQLIIGEPFVKIGADGVLLCRCENPKYQLFFTTYENEKTKMTADQLREIGNDCFRNGAVCSAIDYYSASLEKSPFDIEALSKRADCYLKEHCYELALDDYQRILTQSVSDKLNKPNCTSNINWRFYYYLIRAQLSLNLFDNAEKYLKTIVDSARKSTDIQTTNNGIIEQFYQLYNVDLPRLKQEMNGQYDMIDMLQKHDVKKNKNKNWNGEFEELHAQYEKKDVYEFRQCDKNSSDTVDKGYGVYALCDLEIGTLLFVEEAFVYSVEQSTEMLLAEQRYVTLGLSQQTIQSTGGKVYTQSTSNLLHQIEKRLILEKTNVLDKYLSDLNPIRQYKEKMLKKVEDDDDKQQQFLPYRLIVELHEHNTMSNGYCCGIWPKLAQFNHLCLPNCLWLIIGRFCFLSVYQPIKKGQELTISYVSNYNSYEKRTRLLFGYAINDCLCDLCQYDKNVGDKKMSQLLKKCDILSVYDNDNSQQLLMKISKKLSHTYINRPLGFVEQLNEQIFLNEIKNGYVFHSKIFSYLHHILTKKVKNDELSSILEQIMKLLSYFNLTTTSQNTILNLLGRHLE
ncbi:unnamed protein product [Didymodactylos carnosus]|uniref:SET domain-containing protein n=1 Tax=Didymodactylos carnosus TaxID=1234261 RepID=A0A815IUT9_9BILA|nr:unnamed protein product [Didymodactylos carnosus]CAF1373162.1 unnamed protein product [Didymodactylos carnosus]CAF3880341.1 unnamed protein product [Didymodactylos carnosus]CAF4261284.1 unnamed protein product [Didymodactylos carnosus]